MNQAERLEHALELLRDRGWIQGRGIDDDGHMCSSAAMMFAESDNANFHNYAKYEQDYALVTEVANELFPRCAPYSWEGAISFNDHPDTTFAMVEQTFEKARLRALEMGAR